MPLSICIGLNLLIMNFIFIVDSRLLMALQISFIIIVMLITNVLLLVPYKELIYQIRKIKTIKTQH